MPGKVRVMVLFGGRSAEHEISLLSARFIVESLDPVRFDPFLVGIDREGRWRRQSRQGLLEATADPRRITLQPGADVKVPLWPDSAGASVIEVEGGEPLAVDVVFPVLHGPFGEDGTIQGLFELLGVPYVGAGVLGSAVGMDKDVMKRLLIADQLPLLPFVLLRKTAFEAAPTQALLELSRLKYPLFVKPANLGSSVGISRVLQRRDVESAVRTAFEFDDKVVVEQGLEQPREIECAVLGGNPPVVSVPGEIVVHHPDGFYSYAAKYLDDGATTRIPAELSAAEIERAQFLALRTFTALECSGLARVDLFLSKERELYVNEINTLPGFTAISMFPKLMAASGVPARELVSRLIDEALKRGREKKQRRSSL